MSRTACGPDEGPCQLAQRAARSDDLDLRRIELADQLHDRHGVREQRALAVLAHDAPGRDVARRRAVDEDGLARLDQLERRLGEALLRVDDDLEPLEERVLVAREARQHRAAVRAAARRRAARARPGRGAPSSARCRTRPRGRTPRRCRACAGARRSSAAARPGAWSFSCCSCANACERPRHGSDLSHRAPQLDAHESTAAPADRTFSPRTASPVPMRAPLHDRA